MGFNIEDFKILFMWDNDDTHKRRISEALFMKQYRPSLNVIIKADDGTEHALIESIHIYLRSINEEERIENAFRNATSPQNQRIEACWSVLQWDRLGWLKRLLHDLSDNNLLDASDPVILDCVRFSFIYLVRHDLNRTKEDWDSHIVSKSRNWGPSGRSTCMYNLPHFNDVYNYLHDADSEELQEFRRFWWLTIQRSFKNLQSVY